MGATDFAAALWEAKELYASYVVEQRNIDPQLLEEFESDESMKYDGGGKYFVYPVEFFGGESVGAYRDGGKLPGGPTGSLALQGDQGRINVKLIAMAHRITGLAEASVTKGPKGFFDTLDHAIKRKTALARFDMARQLWGTGRGQLGGAGITGYGGRISAIVGASPGAGQTTITFEVGTNMFHFPTGARLDFYTPAAGSLGTRKGVATDTEDLGSGITSVNPDARQIVIDRDVVTGPPALGAVAVNDVAVKENVGIGVTTGEGTELCGMFRLVQDGDISTSNQNLAYTAWPTHKSYVDDTGGTPRDITEDLLWKVIDRTENDSGKMVDFIAMNKGQRRKLLAIGLSNVRHESAKFRLGYEELKFNGKNLYIDRLAPFGTVFMGNRSQICRVILKDWASADVNAGGERIAHEDVKELAYNTYFNVAIKQTNAWSRIGDLAEP